MSLVFMESRVMVSFTEYLLLQPTLQITESIDFVDVIFCHLDRRYSVKVYLRMNAIDDSICGKSMASTFTNAIGGDVVVVAEIVWRHGGDLDDAFAVVTQPQHTRFLQKRWRIVGVNGSESGGATTTTMTAAGARNSTASADGDATAGGTYGDLAVDAALRLRLEEMYVGLYHGFLTLKQPPGDEDGQEDVDAFCHELAALGQSDRRHQLRLSEYAA